MIWSKLKEMRCPAPCCGYPLKKPTSSIGMLSCSKCEFRISEEKLRSIIRIKHHKLEPPKFIKELRKNENTERKMGLSKH